MITVEAAPQKRSLHHRLSEAVPSPAESIERLRYFMQCTRRYKMNVYMMEKTRNMTLRRNLARDACQTGLAILLFVLGGMIYIVFRTTNLRMFAWTDTLGLDNSVMTIRSFAGNIKVNEFILYSLPDGLWLLAYLLVIDAIWREEYIIKSIFMIALPFMSICSEILQLTGVVKGVFDIYDMVAYIGAILIYKLIKLYAL